MGNSKNRKIKTAGCTVNMEDDYMENESDTVQTTTEHLREMAGDAVDSVKDTMHDISVGASDAVDRAKESAGEMMASAGEAAVHVKERTQEAAHAAADMAIDLNKEATLLIRRNPLTALAVAAALGYLCGQITRRAA